MSADAASLPCPICLHTGVFNSVQSLRDRLISVSTNKTLCPVCQEEVSGLDKLTIHLFKHVKIFNAQDNSEKEILKVTDFQTKPENENQNPASSRQKKVKSVSKNKSAASSINTPVKFVKIYPKLPVVSLNTVPVIDLSHGAVQECLQNGNSMYIQTVKTESSLLQTNTTCNICSLQFVDTNILKMHKCLIHNIDESTNHNFTRYHCHLCPKNFKMRGSLMVHLRVAHYGFSSGNYQSDSTNKRSGGDKKLDQCTDNKLTNYDRNENKQWQCDVCLKCFTTKYFLKKHKRLHTGETPYACTQCNKTFTFQQSYHKHLLYHNDEKPHTCNYCGRAFKELSTLHNHQRIHTGEKPFSCETCGKCFRQRVSYLVHRRIHTGVMPYKCTACNKSFRYKVSQRTHKCQAQPPGTVVRQSGDLIEKLKKKQVDSNVTSKKNKESLLHDMNIQDMSERNINLLRKGAMLSIENTEVENFSLIAEAFNETDTVQYITHPEMIDKSEIKESKTQVLNSEIEDLIDSIPTVDKNVPSPSEILKKLCLSKEDDSMTSVKEDNITNYDMYKEFNTFL